jgi:hypothetical protein
VASRSVSICDYAPNLLALVASRKVSSCTFKDGLAGEWLRDCGPDLGHATVAKFFYMWHVLVNVQLVWERKNGFVWHWCVDGSFSTSLAYKAFFVGRVGAPTASRIWRSRAPYSCKFFVWLSLGTDVGRLIGCKGVAFLFQPHALSATMSQRQFNTYSLVV